MHLPAPLPVLLAGLALVLAACTGGASESEERPLVIGGIPDQDVAFLEERFTAVADYLEDELEIPVVYQPSVDYTAIVTAFGNGDIELAWFGALTGVQARAENPESIMLAQRRIDQEFVSTFIVGADVEAEQLTDLAGHTFTFGSESSTSGHLMPRYFLREAGLDPAEDFASVSFSGSHDQTWKLVEAGSFDAGVLSTSLWERVVEDGEVDLDRVRELERTPEYTNYHWAANPLIDERFGEGTTKRLREVLLSMHESEEGRELLATFDDEVFVPADPDDYEPLEEIARDLGLVGE